MNGPDLLIIIVGGFVAGAFNTAFAGGGLISFLALLYAGVPPLTANAVNLLVMPSSFLGVLPSVRLRRSDAAPLLAACTATVGGALLVTVIPAGGFALVAPWLVAGAGVLLLAAPRLTEWLKRLPHRHSHHRLGRRAVTMLLLACAGGYAGFFGGGVGTLVLAILVLSSGMMLKVANRAKNVVCLATSIAGCAAFTATGLLAPGLIDWPVAAWLAVGMAAGGVFGLWLADHISELAARLTIAVVSGLGALRLSGVAG